ncbi:MAG: hypothetical protein SFY66_07845 [Oculatellaceae cyanobacterium bins.114]|nr:hypothetical protein [Oculatellaceae cyanobacterium bins.114]
MDIDKRINQANGRLKSALIKVAIERRGGTLSLRATLPAKETGKKAYRQKIALGVKATPAGLQFAERRARELANDLDANRFSWADWLEQDDSDSESRITVGEWVERFEADYWKRREKNDQSLETWKSDYQKTFNKLPHEPLTPELLLSVIEKTPADSRNRKRTVQVLARLAKFAGLSVEFGHLVGSYSARRVNPRSLPADALIVRVRDELQHEGWRWVLGMMACYGLRPHEVFLVDLSEFPVVIIPDTNKTKTERFVYPLYPEWAEEWQLDMMKLPNFQHLEGLSNAKRGANTNIL